MRGGERRRGEEEMDGEAGGDGDGGYNGRSSELIGPLRVYFQSYNEQFRTKSIIVTDEETQQVIY